VKTEFERKRKEAEEAAEAKTAKNRSKRQKKKERAKNKDSSRETATESAGAEETEERVTAPFKKRRLVNGETLTFRRPGDESEDEGVVDEPLPPLSVRASEVNEVAESQRAAELPTVTIHDD
jgi:hypothetical protein